MALSKLFPSNFHQHVMQNLDEALQNKNTLNRIKYTTAAIFTGTFTSAECTAESCVRLLPTLAVTVLRGAVFSSQNQEKYSWTNLAAKVKQIFFQIVGATLSFASLTPFYSCESNIIYQSTHGNFVRLEKKEESSEDPCNTTENSVLENEQLSKPLLVKAPTVLPPPPPPPPQEPATNAKKLPPPPREPAKKIAGPPSSTEIENGLKRLKKQPAPETAKEPTGAPPQEPPKKSGGGVFQVSLQDLKNGREGLKKLPAPETAKEPTGTPPSNPAKTPLGPSLNALKDGRNLLKKPSKIPAKASTPEPLSEGQTELITRNSKKLKNELDAIFVRVKRKIKDLPADMKELAGINETDTTPFSNIITPIVSPLVNPKDPNVLLNEENNAIFASIYSLHERLLEASKNLSEFFRTDVDTTTISKNQNDEVGDLKQRFTSYLTAVTSETLPPAENSQKKTLPIVVELSRSFPPLSEAMEHYERWMIEFVAKIDQVYSSRYMILKGIPSNKDVVSGKQESAPQKFKESEVYKLIQDFINFYDERKKSLSLEALNSMYAFTCIYSDMLSVMNDLENFPLAKGYEVLNPLKVRSEDLVKQLKALNFHDLDLASNEIIKNQLDRYFSEELAVRHKKIQEQTPPKPMLKTPPPKKQPPKKAPVTN